MAKTINIEGIIIKQDNEGRYCLNDLHKAAGGEKRHQTADFLRSDQTKEMLVELSNSGKSRNYTPLITRPGRYGGTFVVRELVYAYAMWVSASFHLKVIRFFDKGQTEGVAVAEHAAGDLLANPLQYLKAIIGQAEVLQAERDKAVSALAAAQPKVDTYDAVVADKMLSLSAFARLLPRVHILKVKPPLLQPSEIPRYPS